MAADVVVLDKAISDLSDSVTALDGRIKALPAPVPAVDLQPQVDAVAAIKARVDSELAGG